MGLEGEIKEPGTTRSRPGTKKKEKRTEWTEIGKKSRGPGVAWCLDFLWKRKA